MEEILHHQTDVWKPLDNDGKNHLSTGDSDFFHPPDTIENMLVQPRSRVRRRLWRRRYPRPLLELVASRVQQRLPSGQHGSSSVQPLVNQRVATENHNFLMGKSVNQLDSAIRG